MDSIVTLKESVEQCDLCAACLPLGPKPIIQMASGSKILIAGQAPSQKVHHTGILFNDASGDRLRSWLGVSKETFYDENQFAILPMGFCYPGKGSSGDLPPRMECAIKWRAGLLEALRHIQLTIVLGQYAMAYHLPSDNLGVTQRVANWQQYWPRVIPLPHPSPRNNPWLKRHPWFEEEVLPSLKVRVQTILT
ncbi:uracil-DNA glycosylase family protein [uncultured Shewanella sp.]|uniref:uracil-DNA glycosylase family protein n=1 Tax=uncultured Shewanella sp. TaxID=173975 RepID=UPI0026143110|nr:uracil-DNA glycosylase family protein [uncultured Shewanella sp.]